MCLVMFLCVNTHRDIVCVNARSFSDVTSQKYLGWMYRLFVGKHDGRVYRAFFSRRGGTYINQVAFRNVSLQTLCRADFARKASRFSSKVYESHLHCCTRCSFGSDIELRNLFAIFCKCSFFICVMKLSAKLYKLYEIAIVGAFRCCTCPPSRFSVRTGMI